MKKVREWPPWVKMVVGGAAISLHMIFFWIGARDFQATGESDRGLSTLLSLLSFAGIILLLWGAFEGVARRPRLAGVALLLAGVGLGMIMGVNFPALWEWSKGGVWNFIPAPILLPLTFVLPILMAWRGIAILLERKY